MYGWDAHPTGPLKRFLHRYTESARSPISTPLCIATMNSDEISADSLAELHATTPAARVAAEDLHCFVKKLKHPVQSLLSRHGVLQMLLD